MISGTPGVADHEDWPQHDILRSVLTIGARSDQLRQYRKSSLQGDR